MAEPNTQDASQGTAQMPEENPNSQAPLQADEQISAQSDVPYGPRRMSFFTLVMKTFAGLAGGIAGALVLLIIFLLASSILQPVLSPAEAAAGETSPLFIFVLMAMVFATSVVSSLVSPLLLAYTERERYTRVSTALAQIFIINLVIFAFVAPIYLTASSTRLELSAYAAGLQIILGALSSTLIMELIHDYRYSMLAVYTTVLAVLVATAVNFFIYAGTGSSGAGTTILLFISLPITWTMMGFFQGAITMFYYWLYQNYGIDFLATSTSYGQDYGIPDETEEEQPQREDTEGGNFLKQ